MQPITNSLIKSARAATKFLHRDFLELEILQASRPNNEDFCKKSYARIQSLLQSELQKHSKCLFFPEDRFELNQHNAEIILLINPLDSLINFSRALPFFALSIVYLKKIDQDFVPIYTVLYFPILNEIYYAEKGKGAWKERTLPDSFNTQNIRLRVSANSNENKLLVAGYIAKSASLNYAEQGAKPIYNRGATSDKVSECVGFDYKRNFGSSCYEVALLVSGKLDYVCFSSINFTMYAAFELLVKEAGGTVIEKQQQFIAANQLKKN